MEPHDDTKQSWIERRREQRRLKREMTGDSPEKRAERHEPKRDWVDRWVWSCGIQRRSSF
jgi:hypothetical protein